MKEKYTPFDPADYLKSEKDIAAYFNAIVEEANGDASVIAVALGDIARARGMTGLAKKTGITRAGLYSALSGKGKPEFATILKVMSALGLKLHAQSA